MKNNGNNDPGKVGRPKLGEEVVRLSITLTTVEKTKLKSFLQEGESLARCIVSRALSKGLPDEIKVSDLELLLQIATRCGGKVSASVLCEILNSSEH